MELAIGERVGEPGRDLYVVGERVSTNGLTTLHAARKVFYNYRYDEREFYEAAEDEWMEVRIRTLSGGCLNDAAAAAGGRQLLRYEAESVLGRIPGWFPEPIDWLEHHGQPLLVMSAPRGKSLGEWRRPATGASPLVPQLMSELLNFLEALHGSGQVLGAFGPDDILVDEASRISCTATDRVVAADLAAAQPRIGQSSSCPPPFAAPEVLQGIGPLGRQSDLYSWAAIFVDLMTGSQRESGPSDPSTAFTAALAEVARISPSTLRNMSPTPDSRPLDEIVKGWSNAVGRTLAPEPRDRPASVAALRRVARPSGIAGFVRRLFRQAGKKS